MGGDATVTSVPVDVGQATVAQSAYTVTQADAAPIRNTTASVDSLSPGSTLGGRYEILKLLGEGGMGAVYKARDLEVDRVVALKVIRPEYANRPEILARFKQELVLARQITHRNVIRIFDLGQADGLRFITMEYVEGQELYALLRSAEAPPLERKVKIAREICKALEAAHEQGVVHRDLKPQNIMIENGGRVLVMDFGIARSIEDTGLTSTGALIGTPAFMSPEQAKGEKLDTRSDLFSFGVIFYEMLTGRAPYQADTAVGLLLKRIQERPAPPVEVDKEIPPALSDVVLKCLVVSRDQRYQTAAEVIRDLEGWLGDPAAFRTEFALTAPTADAPTPADQAMAGRTLASPTVASPTLALAENRVGLSPEGQPIITPAMRMMAESHAKKYIALSVAAVLVVGAIAYGVDRYLSRPAGPVAPMTVMIADFNNHTGDPVFSGTLESTLKLALEGASFISAYDRTRMRDLGVPALEKLDDSKAQEIAANQGLNVVVSGSLDKRGAEYQLTIHALQTVTGKVVANAEETASSKDQVLFAVTKLGTAVRKALGDSTSDSAQRLSMETLSATSLEAVHEYAAGLDLISAGKFQEAQTHLAQAVDLDSHFGMAYSSMAGAARNLRRQSDAEKFVKEAVTNIDHMTERERFRTRGYFYLVSFDAQKCVDEYGALLEKYPADTSAYNNIGICYTYLRNIPKALEATRKAVAILPKRVLYQTNVALYSAYAGDFAGAAKEAAKTLQLNPSFAYGFLAQGFASLGQDQPDQAAEAYGKVAQANASLGATSLGDLAVYQGNFQEAVRILEKGAAADLAARTPEKDSAADKYSELAYVQLSRGQADAALKAAKQALDLNSDAKTRFLAARIYAAAGQASKAKELAATLSSETQMSSQAYGKLIEGEIALAGGNPKQAVTLIGAANNLLDTWIGRFDLGRAYLESGQFLEADSEFDRCVKRRGEALALFLDEVPTYGYFPVVHYYQGRAREGMKTAGFAESYKKYLSIRGKASEDPLLADARRRSGQ
jgi:tetratricopeptide (TPR) repeat protein